MGNGFVKVYSTILDSSVWGEPLATRIVWITLLAMADAKGFVPASSDGIARRANASLSVTDRALATLEAPDPRSKSDEYEGRRIQKVDGGYQILNYLKYRNLQTEKQKKTATRQKRYRERKALRNVPVTPGNVASPPKAEAEAEGKAKRSKTTTGASPESHPSWVSEGVAWWKENVGMITHGRFGGALSEAVRVQTWPVIFDALKCYVQEAEARGKPAKLEWFASELIQWVRWAKMPATDDNGQLTIRAEAINREFRK